MTLKFTNLPSGIKDKFWEECLDDVGNDWSDERFKKLSKEYGLFYTDGTYSGSERHLGDGWYWASSKFTTNSPSS